MIAIQTIQLGDLTFDYRSIGDPKNSLIMFLHGFPESSIMWVKLMEKLAGEGYFCVAPNMRGYSKGACPKGSKNYRISLLREDILQMAKALGYDKFHLVGHDWGSAIGWNLVGNNPENILSWSALSVPHNRAFAKAIKTDPIQKKKSRYIGFFLLPWLPELILKMGDLKRLRKLWRRSDEEELNDYLTIFRHKPSLRGALNYYRANIGRGKGEKLGNISSPTLFIWGKYDLAVGKVAATGNVTYMSGPYDFLTVEGGHWLMQSNYEDVESAVVKHITNFSSQHKS